MTLLTASLYFLCLALLLGSALFVAAQRPHFRLNNLYVLFALALLGWVGSLLVFSREGATPTLLWVGRFNFAVIVPAATAGFLFVRELARRPIRRVGWLWVETWALAALSLLTGLVDKAEVIQAGQHVTVYGVLFGLYVAHILLCLTGALRSALKPAPSVAPQARRSLRLIGVGLLVTALIALVTNILLPYRYSDFRWIDVGPLATLLFLATLGYAVFAFHLFSIHLILRRAFVFAGLVTLALELYQAAITFLTHLLPFGDPDARRFAATGIALAINAFTQEPVRRWLERLVDHRRHRDSLQRQATFRPSRAAERPSAIRIP